MTFLKYKYIYNLKQEKHFVIFKSNGRKFYILYLIKQLISNFLFDLKP